MNKKVSGQKQQHYIPVTYSKNFANNDGYIYIKDNWTGKIFPSTPQNSLKQSNLYTQPVHAENRFDNAIENFFSNAVENHWKSIAEDVSNKKNLSRQQWSHIIEFILSMRVRVPNTMKAVMWLLRELVIRASSQQEPSPPIIFVETYQKSHPGHQGPVTYRNLIESGIIDVNIDPHRSITSFEKLIQTNDSVISLPNSPTFLHNKTKFDFISSDNPVISHAESKSIIEIVPYSFEFISGNELIFPISPRTVLLINKNNRQKTQHKDTFSEKTVSLINEKISLYSDRYIFSRNVNSIENLRKHDNVAPIPVFENSKVGNGIVYKIGYKFGEPLKIRNNWKYDFEGSRTLD